MVTKALKREGKVIFIMIVYIFNNILCTFILTMILDLCVTIQFLFVNQDSSHSPGPNVTVCSRNNEIININVTEAALRN